MAEFLVTWETDTEGDDVETPRQAAELARRMQTAPGTVATVFTVLNVATGEATVVDLCDDRADKVRAALTDGQAMELIRSQLSGVAWSPSTLEEIARIVRISGRDVLDASPPGCDFGGVGR
jgi:hypothetical protein